MSVAEVREKIGEAVKAAKANYGIVNVFTIVEQMTGLDHSGEVAREDLEEMILNAAMQYGSAVEFRPIAETGIPFDGSTMIEIEIVKEIDRNA